MLIRDITQGEIRPIFPFSLSVSEEPIFKKGFSR